VANGDYTAIACVDDLCGNTDTCTQTITIDDTIAPVLSGCPADVAVNVDLGVCGAVVNYVGFFSAVSAGVLCGIDAVTEETFGAQGTYTLTDADLDLNA